MTPVGDIAIDLSTGQFIVGSGVNTIRNVENITLDVDQEYQTASDGTYVFLHQAFHLTGDASANAFVYDGNNSNCHGRQ
ncbi:MAG: hypothetical protein WDN06_05315 [Asticcacaulis sp.]